MSEDGRVGGGTAREVFLAFLKLGVTSFGGPIAHLGYFRHELVTRRAWLGEAEYADLVALCQFLPGPASSQVGFALGLRRAGPLGALAAWTGFTMPSAILLVLFAYGAASLDGALAQGVLHGLKLVAVAVVAQAVFGMARSLVTDRWRAAIVVLSVLVVALVAGPVGQVGAIVLGAALGLALPGIKVPSADPTRLAGLSRRAGAVALVVFAALLVGLPLIAASQPALALFDAFYRSGALVFGGGHVVLPLLDAETVGRGWVSPDAFLAGYGAAQAVPGPLFTFAAYLGAIVQGPPNGVVGALIALVGIFLPGMLLLVGVLPFWEGWRTRHWARSAMAGANAAVVGLLGLALYDPVFTSAVGGPVDLALALGGFVALVAWRAAPWVVVVALAAVGGLMGLLAG
ncbi:chromate efflux transporter [Devosia sp. PTR5]|uniref:Chromate efflux transporter n=1 Tax=Devosia oryzisoli TaxID=2774138 RepID=A0A927IQ82_9HYPH|nr:chromate efflux transporter [Devosia oryzisoli]MBD8065355.1 chromate efflux transporter [Devosia oryzisoli]